jgi:hypothetical protein
MSARGKNSCLLCTVGEGFTEILKYFRVNIFAGTITHLPAHTTILTIDKLLNLSQV